MGADRDTAAARQQPAGPPPTAGQMARALELSNDLVSCIDEAGRITRWNTGCELLYGWRADEVLGRPLEQYIPDDELEKVRLLQRSLQAGEEVPPVEMRRSTKDGREVHVSLRMSPLLDDDGSYVGALAVGRDITLEVAQRREVEQARAHLHARLDETGVAHATLCPDGRYRHANDAYCRLLGREPHEVLGQRVLTLSGELDTEDNRALIDGFLMGARAAASWPWSVTRPDGTVARLYVHAATIRTPAGEIDGVALTLQDVTELQRVEVALREGEARWRALALNAVDVAFLAQPDGTMDFVSESVLPQFGYRAEDLVGRQGWTFFHPDDVALVRAAWDRVVVGDADRLSVQARVLRSDGRWTWVEETMVNHLDDPEVRAMVANVRDISDLKDVQDRLAELSLHDGLTGAANRVLLLDRVAHALSRARETGGNVGLLAIGLDGFADVNDRLGNAAGDEAIVAVAQLLSAGLGPLDTLARTDGDRFVVLLEDVDDEQQLREKASMMQLLLSAGVGARDESVQLTASVGLAVRAGGDAQGLLTAAETALRIAKSTGPGGVAAFSDLLEPVQPERRHVVEDLRRGLADDEMVVHYQPVVDLRTGATVGAEALVRWQHPQRALVAPDEFIEVAERSGLILPLGREVLSKACEAAVRWPAPDGVPLRLAVNLSLRQLSEPGVVDLVIETVSRAGLPPERLTLEVTETAMTRDVASTSSRLAALREFGLGISIDDFCTGYSSFTYLRQFPVTAVKIDRSFVQSLGTDRDADAIVRSVITLADAVGVECVAEGAETMDQAERLRRMGCNLAQGFLWAPAMPERDFVAFVNNGPAGTPIAAGAPATAPFRGPARSVSPDLPPAEVLDHIKQLESEGASLHTIAAALNAAGQVTPAGNRWHARSVARVVAEANDTTA